MTFDLKCGDSVDLLKMLPPKSIDLVVTDPPFWDSKEELNNTRVFETNTTFKLF